MNSRASSAAIWAAFVVFSAFAAVLTLFVSTPLLADTAERLTRFESDITVQDDATIHVIEHITVISSGEHIRHGIYRDIVGIGNRRPALKVEAIQRDGQPEPSHVPTIYHASPIHSTNEMKPTKAEPARTISAFPVRVRKTNLPEASMGATLPIARCEDWDA